MERALGDVPLHVQLTKIEIGLSHAADERQNHGTTVLLPCQQVTARRLIRAADPPPDIQLPVQVPLQIVARECGEARDVHHVQPAEGGSVGTRGNLRSKVHPRAIQAGLKFIDARNGHLEILVLV